MAPPVQLVVPSSKSETHRALLLGALSTVPCLVQNPLRGDDCLHTLAVLEALGARATWIGRDIQFQPIDDFHAAKQVLDCGNSGTTLRLLLGQVARFATRTQLTGDASLQRRPNGPLVDALRSLGATVHPEQAPITICGPIQAGAVTLGPRVSSQYASSLLLAMSLLPGTSTLRLQAPIASRPYLSLTETMAASAGLCWTHTEDPEGLTFTVTGPMRPTVSSLTVAGDWSGAAFPLAAGVLHQRTIHLRGLLSTSVQGDKAIVAFLQNAGQHIQTTGDSVQLEAQPLRPFGTLDLGATPDLFPILAVLAAFAPGTTTLKGAPSLRHKECDRIAVMARGLHAMGAKVSELPDGMHITGGTPLHAASIQTASDHRVRMAFLVAASRVPGTTVDAPGCEAVSYPDFLSDLGQITA